MHKSSVIGYHGILVGFIQFHQFLPGIAALHSAKSYTHTGFSTCVCSFKSVCARVSVYEVFFGRGLRAQIVG